jgi:vancomycin resistance protein YoaR
MVSQRHNAQLALKKISGYVLKPGEVFSFNKVVGSRVRDKGYVRAPVSYSGQLVVTWGGGVCQTSTTLYNVALLAGMEILERHPHHHAPHYVPPGRDAAVAFEGVDLKFRNPYDFPVVIQGEVEEKHLCIRLLGKTDSFQPAEVLQEVRQVHKPHEFVLYGHRGRPRIRNKGSQGYEVIVWRITKNQKHLVSSDYYPPMHRIVEY